MVVLPFPEEEMEEEEIKGEEMSLIHPAWAAFLFFFQLSLS